MALKGTGMTANAGIFAMIVLVLLAIGYVVGKP
jgi:hypothetical protein